MADISGSQVDLQMPRRENAPDESRWSAARALTFITMISASVWTVTIAMLVR